MNVLRQGEPAAEPPPPKAERPDLKKEAVLLGVALLVIAGVMGVGALLETEAVVTAGFFAIFGAIGTFAWRLDNWCRLAHPQALKWLYIGVVVALVLVVVIAAVFV